MWYEPKGGISYSILGFGHTLLIGLIHCWYGLFMGFIKENEHENEIITTLVL